MLLIKERQMSPVEPVATPMPSSNSNKIKQLAHQSVNNMKSIQRQRLNLVQTRRKWSEWSECSVYCLRTRHRLNCDDIIAQNATLLQKQQASASVANRQDPTPTANSAPASSSINIPSVSPLSSASKRQVSVDEKASTEIESEDELLQKADQFEDEDYADEGDEEEDQDSCANVDASKTLEEVPCFGGQCRLAIPSAPIDHQLPPAARRPGQQLRERLSSGSGAQQTRLRHDQAPHKVALPPIYDHPVVVDGNSRYHHHLNQPQLQSAHRQRQPASRRNGTTQFESERDYSSLSSTSLLSASSGSPNNNATSTITSNELIKSSSSSSNGNSAATTSSTSGSTNENAIWTTRSMWPPQLLNGDLGPQANLIQWTILIGSLLTIILFIMLILRKLFVSSIPSYHWMLAKQTIKSASGQQLGANHGGSSSSISGSASMASNGNAGFCRSTRRLQHQRALLAAAGAGPAPTTTATTCDPNRLLLDSHRHNQQPIVPHQLCYVWHNSTDGKSNSAALTAMPANFHQHQQFVVDTSGRHLLSGSSLTSAKFNTDHQLIPVAAPHSDCLRASPVYMDVCAAMMTSSSSSSNRSRAIKKRQVPGSFEGGQQQLQPKASQARKQQEFDGLSMVSQNYNYDTLHSDGYGQSPGQHESEVENNAFVLTRDFVVSSRPVQMVSSDLSGNSKRGHQTAAKQSCSSASNRMHAAADIESNGTPDRSNSESRSRASSISSHSSSSIQSTTAQLLSNAASSSFEQPNELAGELGPSATNITGGSSGVLMLQSANASPANNGGKPLHNSAVKLAHLLPQTVQSQPNSPMFANQFTSRVSGRRHKVTPSSVRAPKLAHSKNRIARASSQDNNSGGSHAVTSNRRQGHARRPSVPASDLAATIKLAHHQELASPSQVPSDGSEQVDCDNYYEEIKNQQE